MNLKTSISKLTRLAQNINFLPSFLTRITIATVFIQSGLGKLNHLERTIEYFASLGIPAASIQAPFAAGTEFICGLLILIGLATRFASIPLIVVMVVAIITAKAEDVESVSSLFSISEYLYIVLLGWLVTQGAGRLSVDYLVSKIFRA